MNQSLYPEYCEQTIYPLFLEPLNTLSNLAFIISAIFVYKLLKNNRIKNRIYWILFYLIVLVGIGSILWHTFKNPVTLLLDFLPIFLFILISFYLLIKGIIQNTKITILAIISLVILEVILTIALPRNFLNGSFRHLANSIVLFVLFFAAYKKYGKLALNIIPIFLIYIAAIFFRSIDLNICTQISMGTHPLWHILNGLNTYLVVRFLGLLQNKK